MTIDRRKFLAGTALGAVTAVLLDKQEAKAGNVSGYKARFAMIFDQNKCVGCGACKEACSETNHVPVGQLRMTLERQSPLDGTPGNRKYVRVSCQQCSEPPCVRVCPTGAAHIDPATNIVTMDNSRCVGCKYCIAGCPYNVSLTKKRRPQRTATSVCTPGLLSASSRLVSKPAATMRLSSGTRTIRILTSVRCWPLRTPCAYGQFSEPIRTCITFRN